MSEIYSLHHNKMINSFEWHDEKKIVFQNRSHSISNNYLIIVHDGFTFIRSVDWTSCTWIKLELYVPTWLHVILMNLNISISIRPLLHMGYAKNMEPLMQKCSFKVSFLLIITAFWAHCECGWGKPGRPSTISTCTIECDVDMFMARTWQLGLFRTETLFILPFWNRAILDRDFTSILVS